MERPNKEQLCGVAGTLCVHLLVLLVLLLVVINKPQPQPEAGVPVLMGNTETAAGDAFRYTEVKVAPQPDAVTTTPPQMPSGGDEPLITQSDEQTVTLKSSDKQSVETVVPQKTPEQEEQERQAQEAERKRQEAEEMARLANAKITGAFGKGSTMTDRGDSATGSGNEGSTEGNETTGVTKGVGGYGTFDLSGRSLGEGGLPRPAYNVQDEGRVVVNITVNPDGRVVQTTINSRTNTANPALRKAAIEAAKRALFNRIDGVNNQMGTITYYFKLR